MDINYIADDKRRSAEAFLELANRVWPGEYDKVLTAEALNKTINVTAWDGDRLVGCVKILTDGCFFGSIPEIFVLPEYQGKGIGSKLMRLAFEISPTSLFFGAQPEAEAFYEKLGFVKSLQSYAGKKARRKSI